MSYPSERLILIRPKVYLHESLASYLYRLIKANYFDSINWLANLLSTKTSKICNNEFNEETLTIMSTITGFDKHSLYQMSSNFYRDMWGASIFQKAIVKNRIKYCPFCIHDNYYQKNIWTLYPVSMCLDHNIILVDECPNCKIPVSMDSFMLGYCKCGNQFLKNTESNQTINETLLQSQVDVQRVLNGNQSGIVQLEDLSCKDYLNLVYHSGYLLRGSKSFIHGEEILINAYKNKSNWNSMILFGNVFWMYQDFPKNLYKVLDNLKSRRNNLRSTQHQSYERLFGSFQFKVIQESYEQYWLHEHDKGIVNRSFSIFKKNEKLLDKRKYISREEAKELYSLTNYKISQFETNLQLKKKQIKQGKKNLIMIDKAALENILQLRKTFITQKEAATILGIKKDSMKCLIDAKLLTLVKCPINEHMMIKTEEIELLLVQCRGEYRKGEINDFTFFEALHKFSQQGLSIVNIITLLKENKLHAVSNKTEPKLSDLYFSEEKLLLCIRMMKSEKHQNLKYYMMNDVMNILNIGYKALKNMMKHQVLNPVSIIETANGSKQYYFDKNVINEFSKNHITSNEAVREYKIPKPTIISWVKRGKITDCSKGCCKMFLINKNELNRMIKQYRNRRYRFSN